MSFSPKQFREALQESAKLAQKFQKFVDECKKQSMYLPPKPENLFTSWLKNFKRSLSNVRLFCWRSMLCSRFKCSFKPESTQLFSLWRLGCSRIFKKLPSFTQISEPMPRLLLSLRKKDFPPRRRILSNLVITTWLWSLNLCFLLLQSKTVTISTPIGLTFHQLSGNLPLNSRLRDWSPEKETPKSKNSSNSCISNTRTISLNSKIPNKITWIFSNKECKGTSSKAEG